MSTTFADGMLERAYKTLDRAASAKTPSGIYAAAFRAAEEAAAAIVTTRLSDQQRALMKKPDSMWDALDIADPGLTGWAGYFRSCVRTANLAKNGGPIARDLAEYILSDASHFLTLADGIVQPKEQVS